MAVALGGVFTVTMHSAPQNDNVPAPVPVTQVQPADGTYVYRGPEAPYQSRRLTTGEQQLVKKLFGEQVDSAAVRLHFFAKDRKNLLSDVTEGSQRDIEIYGRKNASADYSGDKAGNFGTFIYEMTRIWQNQTGETQTLGNKDFSLYPLSSEFVFQDYGRIQQAQIMEDYALRFLHPARQSHWLPAEYGGDKSDTDPFLQTLVETQFPAAAEARVAFANVTVRGLTQGEAALLKGIFGTQLDTVSLRLNLHPQEMSDMVGSVEADLAADFWGPGNHSPDYSREKYADKFGTFVHEVTHNWQRQTEQRFTNNIVDTSDEKYLYPLAAKYSFPEYTTEQQAAIMEDYARRFLHPTHSHTYLQKTYKNPNSMDRLLIRVVEDQFPNATTLRQDYQRNETAPKVSSARMPFAAYG